MSQHVARGVHRLQRRVAEQVGAVPDEFHRFVTADSVHGEQSFLDTCRSFNAFCVLACQSMASVHHALAGLSGDGARSADVHAVDILLANTGSKFFFRTTDRDTLSRIASMAPSPPGMVNVIDVRPPSTLRAGECYISLPDGRFERRQVTAGADRARAVKTPPPPSAEPHDEVPAPLTAQPRGFERKGPAAPGVA